MSEKPFVTIYFKLEDLIKPIYSPIEFVGRQVMLKNWICDGNVPDQYTGLKDKAGREIFEGDIVSYNLSDGCPHVVKGEVLFDEKDSAYIIKSDIFDSHIRVVFNIKVIGNSHEHSLISIIQLLDSLPRGEQNDA